MILNNELKKSQLIRSLNVQAHAETAVTVMPAQSDKVLLPSVYGLEDRCELKGHIWLMKSSQKERSGCQPDLNTYRHFIRWHPHTGGPETPATHSGTSAAQVETDPG